MQSTFATRRNAACHTPVGNYASGEVGRATAVIERPMRVPRSLAQDGPALRQLAMHRRARVGPRALDNGVGQVLDAYGVWRACHRKQLTW